MLFFLRIRKKNFKLKRLIMLISITAFALALSTGCGQTADTTSIENNGNTSVDTINTSAGLTSLEAEALACAEAKKVFDDAVLWRLAPIAERYSTNMRLDSEWQNNDRSSAWFVWYADPVGENWFMISIQGESIVDTDIGTRGSIMSMNSSWPRQSTAISMKDAASAATKQGANLDMTTWVEFTCDYPSSDFRRQPLWVFACLETLDTGGTLNYRMFVDAITGTVIGAINDRDERMTLPINIEKLQKTRTVNHEGDLRQFFSFIAEDDPIWAVRQLAYKASPNEETAQQWLANFQSLQSLTVVSIEQANLEQWTDVWESYKVVLDVTTSEPFEKYGWENGQNVRWVTLILQGSGAWKVASLAQSP